ncbi:MAG: hypothetical protein E7Z79_02380 [Methanobrevibacter thaueri]|uniref:DUF4145 domain-containing protein n=1 Tax=Methanobrevibacter thaueri TaxID=190975 RepID=A0A8T3V8V2_9EURY|nr:hypothetical protein [Methanobrevibacter thaueri]MBE6501269.1 hypothetical protein [Methanobrevibacter thaueri]
MSANFDFLRNFDNDLHYLACIIEDEIYDSPSAVLTDATTFLEIIIYDIFKKNELKMDDLVYFKDKIMFLSQAGFLSPELKKHMLKAYSIRNKMHSYNGDAKNHIQLNQLRAVHLHKLLFNVSWLYYSENSPDQFKVAQPSYIHPSRLKNDILIKSEIGNGKCIICESKTKSEDELFCQECKYKIEKSDNLKTLRKHFGFKKGIKRNELIEMGFEKGYIGPFLQELKNDDLINSVGKLNFIDKENTDRYVEEAEAMISIEKLLSDFKLKNLGLNDIINHEFYQKGKDGQYPYVGLYHLFREISFSEFLSQINMGTSIEEILNKEYLTSDELDDWYFNNDGPEHDIFNEKLIDEIFYYKRRDSEGNFKISDEILSAIKETELYLQKEDELLFTLFLRNTSRVKITKKEALDGVGLSENDLEGLLIKYPNLKEKYDKTYVKNKMDKFLKFCDYYNYTNSLKRNGLVKKDIEDWINEAKNTDNEIYSNFLRDYEQLSLKKYIEYRKNGHTKNKSLKKINCDSETIARLLSEHDNDLDIYLANSAAELLKSGKTKEETLQKLDIEQEWFNTSIEKGMKGEETYVELYHEYSENSIPRQMDEFLENIKIKPLKNVLKDLDMDENELNRWYEEGKNSVQPYDNFYDKFLEYKKETYVKTMIKTDSKPKALKKSYMTKEELNEFEEELNNRVSEKSLEIVIDELKKGNTTKMASKKASIKISVIYEWIKQALNGNEYYEEFLNVYKEEYLIPIKMGYAKGVKEGATEKEIIRTLKRHQFLVNDDVKHLKQLNLFPKPGDNVIELDEELELDLNGPISLMDKLED